MSLADVTSARSSPTPEGCPDCDTSASVTSDLHKYQVACACAPACETYACARDCDPPTTRADKRDAPPALPPRPPNALLAAGTRRNNSSVGATNTTCRQRKYAWWCCGCGALAAALGGLLAAQHIVLRAYTASPHLLETVPAAVPAAMLVLTGVCIMSLARRRNRYSYMIKIVGVCCLICALTCVLVTITTTVIHMNKLQTLKFCVYTKLTRTCTCYSTPPDDQHSSDEGIRCVFEAVRDCGVVHGALYWCLRGVFALSVSAVLVCIASCMLNYQLLSHERKKMYWEQLELRCRSLYRPPSGQQAIAARPRQTNCSCCSQCHPSQPQWDISLQHRFWAPGRIGNLYSPNPGTARKTSAWSWFPWPRSNSHNSRCRMGVPQSGDSAYGFCDTDTPTNSNPNPTTYDDRYPPNMRNYPQNTGTYPQNANYPQNAVAYQQNSGNFNQEGFSEAGGSYDAQTGVWGPPPPYSPQGRSGSRHHLHQDPATATLLHHHHIDVHRSSMQIHDHSNLPIQAHTCSRNSYLIPQNIDLTRLNPELIRMNPDLLRMNPELARLNPELVRMNPELSRLNPELARLNPELVRLNPEISRMNPELVQINPELAHLYPQNVSELMRLQSEIGQIDNSRFNTLRGHLVPYPTCQRSLGMSASNLHRDCRLEDNLPIECLHQKSASKVSDQSSDSSIKQGKENLGFQNDKLSLIRASMQDCHRNGNLNAESEVYFADGSSCCNVSVKTDCCMKPNVSALVGTIENQPESTSESDTGSFTLTRQQRPQPQVGSKRRPRQNDKHLKTPEKIRQDINTAMRLTEQQIEKLNNTLRMNESRDRLNESRIERMNESRISERNESRERVNDSRLERINDSKLNERLNDCRLNDSRRASIDRLESRNERLDDSRVCERMNESKQSDRFNESRMSDRMNESRISDRTNESRVSDRMNESRISDRMNESRISDRMNETRASNRMNDSRHEIMEDRRKSDMNSSIRIEGSPKLRTRMSPRIRSSPKNLPNHPRQSSSDSNKAEFFVPPPPAISPLSPKTEESLLSEDDDRNQVYSNDQPESSKRLGPDSQYEMKEKEEAQLKTNHHHCYSDTNTMDSGWQSGSEKHVTD